MVSSKLSDWHHDRTRKCWKQSIGKKMSRFSPISQAKKCLASLPYSLACGGSFLFVSCLAKLAQHAQIRYWSHVMHSVRVLWTLLLLLLVLLVLLSQAAFSLKQWGLRDFLHSFCLWSFKLERPISVRWRFNLLITLLGASIKLVYIKPGL